MSLIRSSRAAIASLAAFVAAPLVGGAQAGSGAPSPITDSSAVYTGVYASTFNESIFSPCDIPGIDSGWSLRFKNERDGAFLRYQYGAAGMATLAHFIRVRGRVSAPGRYGLGFHAREIVVDSVLEVKETLQPCPSYEDLPQPWEAIRSTGAEIIGAAITDDKVLAAVFDLDGTIGIWNVTRGTLMKQFPSEDKGELSWGSRVPMEFTSDGKRLAVGGVDGVVRVWNPLDGQRVWTFAATDTMQGTVNGRTVAAPSLGLEFNQSGTLLANMVSDKIAFWSTVSGQRIGTFKAGVWGAKVLFIGDSSFIASGDSGLMKIYPRLGAPPIWRIKSPVQRFDVMEPSPDGRWLVVKSWGDTAYLWSLNEGAPAQRIAIPGWSGQGAAVAFSPDGNTIAMPGGANGLYLWETKTGRPLRSFQKYPMGVQKAWFTPDGRSIVSYSMADTVFRIVHLDAANGVFGAPKRTPVQAWWAANSWPAETTGRSLGSISGFVRDSAKKPIVGAKVSLVDGDRPGSTPFARTSTNAAGRYLAQNIKVQHVVVRAAKPGYSTETRYTHLPAQGVSVDFNLRTDTTDR
jgi:WD40 repeat protein